MEDYMSCSECILSDLIGQNSLEWQTISAEGIIEYTNEGMLPICRHNL